jgi:hypothetical protein
MGLSNELEIMAVRYHVMVSLTTSIENTQFSILAAAGLFSPRFAPWPKRGETNPTAAGKLN